MIVEEPKSSSIVEDDPRYSRPAPRDEAARADNIIQNKDSTPIYSAVLGKASVTTQSTASRAAQGRAIYTIPEYNALMDKREQQSFMAQVGASMDHPGWPLAALVWVAAAVAAGVIMLRLRRERFKFDPQMRQVKAIDIEGGVSIGGPFELTDTNGNTVTHNDLNKKWSVIYFGFSNCVEVCPQEMAKMTRTIKELDKKVGKDYWQPVFISIDPKRDTPAVVKEYLADFHPRFLGLTGTQEQIDKVAREFRVFFAIPDEFNEKSEDYLIDHSIIWYVMEPTADPVNKPMQFSDYMTKDFTWFEQLSKVLRRMADYEQRKSTAGAADANLRVANLGSTNPVTDAAPGKEAVPKSNAVQEREKREKAAGERKWATSADIFNSWGNIKERHEKNKQAELTGEAKVPLSLAPLVEPSQQEQQKQKNIDSAKPKGTTPFADRA